MIRFQGAVSRKDVNLYCTGNGCFILVENRDARYRETYNAVIFVTL